LIDHHKNETAFPASERRAHPRLRNALFKRHPRRLAYESFITTLVITLKTRTIEFGTVYVNSLENI
jgi:hypothetical protein